MDSTTWGSESNKGSNELRKIVGPIHAFSHWPEVVRRERAGPVPPNPGWPFAPIPRNPVVEFVIVFQSCTMYQTQMSDARIYTCSVAECMLGSKPLFVSPDHPFHTHPILPELQYAQYTTQEMHRSDCISLLQMHRRGKGWYQPLVRLIGGQVCTGIRVVLDWTFVLSDASYQYSLICTVQNPSNLKFYR